MTTSSNRTPQAISKVLRSRITRLLASGESVGNGSPSWFALDMATLAELRRGAGKEPGSVPGMWPIALPLLDGLFPSFVQPSLAERAVHHTLVLYATHRQGKNESVFTPDVSMGAAARRLADSGLFSEEAVRRRFNYAATAQSLEELANHARGLVTQFRTAGIGIDYGLLAADLFIFGLPESTGKSSVRRQWGRDYYRHANVSLEDIDTVSPND